MHADPLPKTSLSLCLCHFFLCGFFFFFLLLVVPRFSLLFVAFGFYRPVVCGLLAVSEAFWNSLVTLSRRMR
ncbi:hypothetical protein QR685DRAFT_522967 [Neurospora intermedia]|uniref:Transmembrane protein n=1 Tax=Neurospora intermedia TaxID=5142 RepID=A0ABR3DBW1_NEUIN